MEKLFKLKEHQTNIKTEAIAGLTTFFTLAYIIFANPSILADAGMNWNGVFVATCISAAIGTLIMALFANLPYAQAPGMGINAFFAYTICLGMGFVWQEALAMVFICGIIAIILTVSNVRRMLLVAIPTFLQNAIGGGIGLFIAYVGLKNAGIIGFGATVDGFTPGAAAVPTIVDFNSPGVLLSLIGILITTVLMLKKVSGAMLIGIVATALIGIPMGVTVVSGIKLFDMSAVADVKLVAFSFFGSPGLGSLFSNPSRLFVAVVAIFALTLSDIFNTIGTFIGTGRTSGIFTDEDIEKLRSGKGYESKIERGLIADMIATTCGALLGTSNVTTYVESATGIGAGGRTGLTSVFTALLFLLCVPFASLMSVVPAEATAPALIIIGVLMMGSFSDIDWYDFEVALPSFFCVLITGFGYSISYGIAAGLIFYCIVKICKDEMKDIHPILAGSSILFIINFILLAIT